MKHTFIFSVVTVIVGGFFLTCENPNNPFSNNLGAKVDVEPPTIMVTSPAAGDFIRGVAQFTGKATAYRELRSVQVRIYSQSSQGAEYLQDWSPAGVDLIGNDAKEKTWTYTLDTQNFLGQSLEDGILRIQFRARDPNLSTNTEVQVYIVKNKPSKISLSAPDVSNFDPNYPGVSVPTLQVETGIGGSVTDRRGIKPGYPKIKIWPENMPEPRGNDTDWGWAQLFLSGASNPDGNDDLENWTYTDRTETQVVRGASFAFNLGDFIVDAAGRAVYRDGDGFFNSGKPPKPMEVGRYRFRIYTRETFFYPETLLPRDPEGDEYEIDGYYPEINPTVNTDPQNSGPYYVVDLVSSIMPPEIDINNDDITPQSQLAQVPNYYMVDQTEKKLLTGGTPARPYFRLRVLARHDEGIARAVLEWEHRSKTLRSGYLAWDPDPAGEYAVDNESKFPALELPKPYDPTDYNKAKYGFTGKPKGSQADGSYFVFTALDNMSYIDLDGASKPGNVFTPSLDPYTLKVTVYTETGAKAEQTYTVYLNDTPPEVTISSVRGAELTPDGDAHTYPEPPPPNIYGTINEHPYTVNGNIQVSINSSADMGITQNDAGEPWMRWIVEADNGGEDYLVVLQKLKDYITTPTAAGLSYFTNLPAADVEDSEWVKQSVGNSRFETERKPHINLNASSWGDGSVMWLYVIVQDSVHNLGFTLQQFTVDEAGDLPKINIPGLVDTGTIANEDALKITVGTDGVVGGGNSANHNIIDTFQGIDLTFTDDDGIDMRSILTSVGGGQTGGVSIILEDIDHGWGSVTLNDDDLKFLTKDDSYYLIPNNRLELAGMLDQQTMANVLYNNRSPSPQPAPNPPAMHLYDGRYKLTILIKDNLDVKVEVDGLDEQKSSGEKVYYFAVQSEMPEIKILNPNLEEEGLDLTKASVNGTVRSSFELQHLYLNFSAPIAGISSITFLPATDSRATLTKVNEGDYYVYNWSLNGNFDFLSAGSITTTVTAYDALGSFDQQKLTVEVDALPPELELAEFNFGRLPNNDNVYTVNGKVPVYISAIDDVAIGESVINAQTYVDVQWWLRPSTAAAPTITWRGAGSWNGATTNDAAAANSYTGRFLKSSGNDGTYLLLIDTRALPNGAYRLYAIARDKALNESPRLDVNDPNYDSDDGGIRFLREFTVDQSADDPTTYNQPGGWIDPPDNSVRMSMGLAISGAVFDDDDFDPASPRISYAAEDYGKPSADQTALPVNGTYVQIRFRITDDGPARWTGWYDTACTVEDMYLGFSLDIEAATLAGSTAFEGYFAYPGPKNYQVRITDEPVASELFLQSGIGNPGKNPEKNSGVTPGFSIVTNATYQNQDCVAVTATFPAGDNHYTFELKNEGPKVWFKTSDPDKNHEGKYYNRVGGVITDNSNYTEYRPSFNSRANLLAALQDIYIQESYAFLSHVYVNIPGTNTPIAIFDRNRTPPVNAPPFSAANNPRHYFNGAADWISFWPATGTQPADGFYSITIEAEDTVGLPAGAPSWDFFKDTQGPRLEFITDIVAAVTRGPGEPYPYLEGTFEDDWTWINNTFEWRLSGNGVNTSFNAEPIVQRLGDTSALWRIVLQNNRNFTGTDPNANQLEEGEYTLYITGSDLIGNKGGLGTGIDKYNNTTGEWGPFNFILDHRPPIVTEPDDMVVSGNNLSNASAALTPQKLKADKRVFSAADIKVDWDVDPLTSNVKVFTLSGLVYEYTLDGLKAEFSNGDNPALFSKEITGIAATPPYQSLDGSFRVRKAQTTELGVGAAQYKDVRPNPLAANLPYLYVWELDVSKEDFFKLMWDSAGGDDDSGTPRQITVTATDRAGFTSQRDNWRFYLDNESPKVEFLNLSDEEPWSVINLTQINLSLKAEDNTGLREVQYIVAKYNYGDSKWYYYSSAGAGGWTLASPPTPLASGAAPATKGGWRRLYGPTPDEDSIEKLAYLNVTNTELENSGVTKLSSGQMEEGQYRVELYVNDWSLSINADGNPSPGNPEFIEPPIPFFIDRNEPEITWKSSNHTDSNPSHYRVVDDKLEFYFTVFDVNTIADDTTATLRNQAGTITVDTNVEVTFVGDNDGAATLQGTITFEDLPAAFAAGTNDGNWTVYLTITDGAGITASIGDSQTFYLDNSAPAINLSAIGVTERAKDAVVGRVEFNGLFTKGIGASGVARVAFKVATAEPSIAGAAGMTGAVLDTWLKTNGWYFNDGSPGDPASMAIGSETILIEEGTINNSIIISNTRGFNSTSGLISGLSSKNITFNGKDITGAQVHDLTIYLFAVDEAGNMDIKPFTFLVYPAGDYPVVTKIINPAEDKDAIERILNGRFRLSGTAEDNVHVKYVWFRILDEDNTPIKLSVSAWDETKRPWESVENTTQNYAVKTAATPAGSAPDRFVVQTTEPSSMPADGGWYKANGGDSKTVGWWVYVNEQGELDPQGGETTRPIKIEVFAEDTYLVAQNNDLVWDTNPGYLSDPVKTVTATMVSGAPRFEDQKILLAEKIGSYVEDDLGNVDFTIWSDIADASIRGEAYYSVTVKNEMGISGISWNRGQSIDLMGIEVKDMPGLEITARPKELYDDTAPTDQYMIWEPLEDRYQKTTTVPSGGTALKADANGLFEWVVIIKVNSALLRDLDGSNTTYSGKAVSYPITLKATDISKTSPLTREETIYLPIDNLPPVGMYTHSASVAGSAVTFGGEAGDFGEVRGLSKVVLWFSRVTGGVDTAISWAQMNKNKEDTDNTFAYLTTENGNSAYPAGTTLASQGITVGVAGNGLPATVALPRLEAYPRGAPTATTSYKQSDDNNYSWIVIDEHDPRNQNPGYGYQLAMGLATIGGDYGTGWYVTLDSTQMTSGQVTAHYIVYDKAGNATYYNKKLMILNNVPKITGIRLGTDIRGNNAGVTTLKASNQALRTDTEATGFVPGALALIRRAFGIANTVSDIPTDDDYKYGISDFIPINTGMMGEYSVVYDQPFNARNNMLSIRVETEFDGADEGEASSGIAGAGGNRYFRFEYVSGARQITGRDALVNATNGIKRGKVYIIDNYGNDTNKFPWGSLGAKARTDSTGNMVFRRGIAFIAVDDGSLVNVPQLADGVVINYGNPSVWELNSDYYSAADTGHARVGPTVAAKTRLALGDAIYNKGVSARNAEFVYGTTAFNTGGRNGLNNEGIIDFIPTLYGADNDYQPMPYPALTSNPNFWQAHSLFIVRVFEAYETDNATAVNSDPNELFGDFILLSLRVNNNDVTPPFAQVYDINPKTEGVDRAQTVQRSLAPQAIGSNRTMGGLWNEDAQNLNITKPGHIEPRKIAYTARPYNNYQHSLSSLEMGGAADENEATVYKPVANPDGFFTADTVSGRVILRGYVEDDQRIERVELLFGNDPNPTAVTILEYNNEQASAGNTDTYVPPSTGLLRVPNGTLIAGFPAPITNNPTQAGKVFFTDTIDLYRHRVEWAYIWDTETIPGGNAVVGSTLVRVRSYNRNTTTPAPGSKTNPVITLDDARPHTLASMQNPDFPLNLNKYNSISFNLRPYITGFKRNQTSFSHDTRSRQGRYMFYRGETAVVQGFNLGTGFITLPGMGNETLNNVATPGNYGITTANNTRYRQFTVNAAITGNNLAVTGNGLVRLSVNNFQAVNTSDGSAGNRPIVMERTGGTGAITVDNATYIRPTVIQPWNTERNPAIEGSELWDDFTMVHIWQSNGNTNNTDNGTFRKGTNMIVEYPAMTIDPRNGNLFESHYEGGGNGNNTATIAVSGNSNANIANNPAAPGVNIGINGSATAKVNIVAFCDPIYEPDIYISDAGTLWSAYNVTGRMGGGTGWANLGGIWVAGPGGGNPNLTSGLGQNNQYHAESTFFRDRTDQFSNPHLAVHVPSGTNEYIHVSYYDAVSHAIKYRFILRNSPGTVNAGNRNNGTQSAVWMWTNLDGGSDGWDTGASAFVNNNVRDLASPGAGNLNIAQNARMVTGQPGGRSGNAGMHNSIALTRQGYPVIAYYDEANQRLKLAVSNIVAPVLGANWKIIDGIFDSTIAATGYADTNALYRENTGQFVSLKIDTRDQNAQVFHIAAMNSAAKNLVYITGSLNVNATIGNYTISNVKVQIVDSVGSVGRWCKLSLDANGNPWIAYQDESYTGQRDGVKAAYLDTNRFIKGSADNFSGQDIDLNGTAINGWEAMHVPTQFRVNNAQVGMERFPTIRNTGAAKANGLARFAAVGYLGEDQYRVAYYVE